MPIQGVLRPGFFSVTSLVCGILFTIAESLSGQKPLVVGELSAGVTLLTAAFEWNEHQRSKRQRRLEIKVDELSRQLRERPAGLQPTIQLQHPFLRSIADRIAQEYHDGQAQLTKPARVFASDHDYFEAVIEDLLSLPAGSLFDTACADTKSAWRSKLITRYAVANMRAVKERDVRVSRVILAHGAGLSFVGQQQADAGIIVSVLKEGAIRRLPANCRIGEDVGFGIVQGRRVYLHYRDGTAWHGYMYDAPSVVRGFVSVLQTLRRHATPLPPSGADAKAGSPAASTGQ